jgi:hypothetical protein
VFRCYVVDGSQLFHQFAPTSEILRHRGQQLVGRAGGPPGNVGHEIRVRMQVEFVVQPL